jgi:hypothetical protein
VRLVNIGYGNVVVAERVVAVISPDSAPMKRFKDEARKAGRLIDGTQGRRTRSILITDSHHIVLSALQTETVAERLARGAYVPQPGQVAAPSPPTSEEAEAPLEGEASPEPQDAAESPESLEARGGDGDGDGDARETTDEAAPVRGGEEPEA